MPACWDRVGPSWRSSSSALDRPDAGSLEIDGTEVNDFSPAASIQRGVALAPEDRKAEGIVADLSVRENIILAMQANRGWLRHLGAREAGRDR